MKEEQRGMGPSFVTMNGTHVKSHLSLTVHIFVLPSSLAIVAFGYWYSLGFLLKVGGSDSGISLFESCSSC